MRERPILFNSEMIRAILDNRKSQTRRIIKPQPDEILQGDWSELCPYGRVGDKLWVRETLSLERELPERKYFDVLYVADRNHFDETMPTGCDITQTYLSMDNHTLWFMSYKGWWDAGEDKIIVPNIHMPKWVARIWLEITGIRVERVQDISEEDAKAEGIVTGSSAMGHIFTAKEHFKGLWDSLNAKRGYSWESNPWIWCIEFRNYTNDRGKRKQGKGE